MKNQRRQVNIPQRGEIRTDYSLPENKSPDFKKYLRPIVILSIVLVIIYLVFFSKVFHVSEIKVEGKTTLPASEIISQTYMAIDSSVMGKNILFLNTNHVADYISNQNYQFSEVRVERDFITGLKVIVKEKQPSIIWQTGASSYVLSDDGRAITDSHSNYSDLPTIKDSANLPVKLGDKVAPANFVKFVLDMLKGLNDRGIAVVDMEVPETTSEIYARTNKNYLIKFDTNRDIHSQLSSLDSVIKTISSQNKKPSEYIDLRIEGRVFYK